MSRRKSEDKTQADLDKEEQGIGHRRTSVLHSPNRKRGTREEDAAVEKASERQSGDSSVPSGELGNGVMEKTISNGSGISPTQSASYPPFHRDIVFADEVSPAKEDIANEDRIPEQRSNEQHIAFVENQRNPKDKSTLWIPGPRDVERGYRPKRIEEGDSSSDADRESLDPRAENAAGLNLERPIKGEMGLKGKLKSTFAKFKKEDEHDDSPKGLRSRVISNTRSISRYFSQDKRDTDPLPYLSYTATIGRNSTFVDLTEEQREELGGIEYRALKTLAWILIIYYLGFFIISWIIMVPWIVRSRKYSAVVREDGQSTTWWGFFTVMSMFTDLGFTLTPDSMVSFQRAVLPLLLGTFLIIAGNTGFPCLLRFMIWISSKCVPVGSGIWEELRFLLDHPRRCFTLLFPQKATWWLFGVLVILNGLDLIFFILLDIKDSTVTSLPAGFQFLDGLFQAASTRTAGFGCVSLADLHPGIQVSYLIMMYISVFPIAISVRQTNVYEEKSLGIYGSQDETEEPDMNSHSYLGSHLRRQLSFDLWYVFLGLFLITIIEGSRIENVKEPAFTIFSCLFEIVSAYGTVGLSLGYPNINASFSAEFRTLSKLVIIAMMLRGRHRGLPYALDRAILLPSESLQRKEQEMDELRRERRASIASLRTPFADGTGAAMPPSLGELASRTNASKTTARSKSRHGLKRIVTGALNPGTTLKHHHH
jgi:potassium uptake Trk family protein